MTICGKTVFAVAALSVGTCLADLVPDPFRAADVKWPKHECKGRTWRYLLSPEAQTMDAMKDEPFAQDAGYNMIYCPGEWPEADGKHAFDFKDEDPEYKFIVKPPMVVPDVLKRMKDFPFIIYEWSRCVWDLPREKCDLTVYDGLIRDYPDTFLGTMHGEWDAGVLYSLPRKASERYLNFAKHLGLPCSREEMAQHFCDYVDIAAVPKGPRHVEMSGPCNLNHFGCERGSTLAMLELTLEQSWRAMMMHTRGSGRQYGVPLSFYIAFFLGQNTADTRPGKSKTMGENWGIPPNLAYRAIMLAYYQGCNYQAFECFPWAFVKEKVEKVGGGGERKTTVLTENGEYLKKAYDFIRSPEGERGEFYAPILLLADWAHGHDGLNRRISTKDGWGPFANQYPPTIFDQFYQDVLDAISPEVPPYNAASHYNATNGYQCCLVNSELNDIFDLYIANPRTKGKELRADQLAKYSVVMSLGGIRWTDAMKNLVRDYVAKGGTFVNVEGEEPVIKHKIGYGNILTAPRDAKKLRQFLKTLQEQVRPVRVSSDCELVWNAMPDGSWRVCAVNNKGVEKPPATTESKFHDECWSEFRIFEPKGRKLEIRELLAGQKPATGTIWKIPPGAVRVFEIKGLDCHAKTFDLSKIEDPNVPPYEFPLNFKHDDTGNYDVAEIIADYDTDEVTVECRAKPLPAEEWKKTGQKHLEGSPFMVGQGWNSASKNFGPTWRDGCWYLKRNTDKYANWMKGPKADPNRFTKLAATLKDGTIHLFVDDKEIFSEEGPVLHPEGTPKCRFYNLFTFWRGTSSFRTGWNFLGEVRDCHAYSKAIYPLKYEVKAKGEGEDATAEIQRMIDAAVEKTGEVVVKKGMYKVSQLKMRTGVTLHLEEEAVIQGDIIAKDITDFTLLGPGAVDGTVAFEGVQRATVRRLIIVGKGAKLTMKDTKNVIVEDSKLPAIDKGNSTRIRVDGKII